MRQSKQVQSSLGTLHKCKLYEFGPVCQANNEIFCFIYVNWLIFHENWVIVVM